MSGRRMVISLYSDGGYIYIGREILHKLGEPDFITLLVNKEGTSIAVCPCEESEAMSFRTPDSDKIMRVCSKAFVRDILAACHLKYGYNYSVEGSYSENAGAVICDVSNSAARI